MATRITIPQPHCIRRWRNSISRRSRRNIKRSWSNHSRWLRPVAMPTSRTHTQLRPSLRSGSGASIRCISKPNLPRLRRPIVVVRPILHHLVQRCLLQRDTVEGVSSLEGLQRHINGRGTFWTTDAAIPDIDALGTGSFLVLSALLAEATSDHMYLDAATESADFVQAHLYNRHNLVQDSISSRANDSCAVNEVVGPYNSGLMIHELGILADITGNATMRDLFSDILLATIPNATWQKPDGIVGDLELVQGLGVVYSRNSTTAALRAYIESYLAVQFNAVTELATSPGTNIYALSWPGPPSAAFSGVNQTVALSSLISAMNLGQNDSTLTGTSSLQSPLSQTPNPTHTPTSSESAGPSKESTSRGIIIGVAVGVGGSAVIVTGLVLWLLHRRRRARRIGASVRVALQTRTRMWRAGIRHRAEPHTRPKLRSSQILLMHCRRRNW
ncbi:hypothetical protein B0H19DRAFT_1007144 [Mycena capillaripes]|nr:hypothetical protein B0H19DRAFT_1007144 [Mycena capillaripes]